MAEAKQSGGSILDPALLFYFTFWYLGNYYYNISNKLALKEAGGKDGFPMTIATLQLGVGVVYALFAWILPDLRALPKKFGPSHVGKMFLVGFCSAAAHSASVFALSAGAVSFGQIVKAAEPVFAAVVGMVVYGKPTRALKWLCLVPVVGGVCLASVKELDFAWSALFSAGIANLFAAFKGQESKKLMGDLKEDLGSVGNQFAITTIIAFLISLPVMYAKEGAKFPEFLELLQTNTVVRDNLIISGLTFYGYNELATMTLKKTSGVTQSVANTAKRVVIIVGTALRFGESMEFMKMVGCSIAICGVFVYSSVDSIFPPAKADKKTK